MRPEFGSELLTNVITAVILIGLLVSAALWISQSQQGGVSTAAGRSSSRSRSVAAILVALLIAVLAARCLAGMKEAARALRTSRV